MKKSAFRYESYDGVYEIWYGEVLIARRFYNVKGLKAKLKRLRAEERRLEKEGA